LTPGSETPAAIRAAKADILGLILATVRTDTPDRGLIQEAILAMVAGILGITLARAMIAGKEKRL